GAAVPLVAAASVATRAILVPAGRRAWGVLAVGLGAWAACYAAWVLHLDYTHAGAALGAFFALYPCAAVFLVLEARARCRRVPPAVWLDLTAAMLAVGALGFGLVLPLIPEASATVLAFPVLDVALVALVVGLFAIARWSPGRAWLAWGLAFGMFAAADLVWAAGGRSPE